MRRLAALAVIVVLSACSRGHDAGSSLRFWAMGREGEVVAALMPEFERRNPGVHVRVQQIPWSAAHEKLLTAYVGEAMPDVFQAGNTWLPELAALDALEPLDARIAASTAVAPPDYFPGILATNAIDGRTLGVPWYVDTRVLFYRTDLLDAVGARAPPRTWEEWLDVMGRLAAAAPGRYAILLPMREWQVPVVLALQQGATLLRDGERFGNFRSAPVATAFRFYTGLFRRGLAPAAGDTAVANVYQDFARGWFAFYLTGPWNLGEFARRLTAPAADHWSTAPLPGARGEFPGVSLAGGASLAVFRGSPAKDAAWRLVEYLSAPEQQARFYRLTGDLPARRAAWIAESLPDDPRARAFWIQLQTVAATPKIPEWERIAARIGEHAESAVRGAVAVDDALAALDADVDGILAKRRWLLETGR